MGFDRGAVRVVTHTAFFEHSGRVCMNLFKARRFMAIKAASFEAEAGAGCKFVALSTFDSSNGWMLLEGREFSRRVGPREKANFFTTTFPLKNQGVRPWANLQFAVEHVRKGLSEFERLAIEFQLA